MTTRIGSPGGPLWDPDAVPAATVVVLREGTPGAGPEVLMVKRDAGLSFAGGMWVFPGGRIDPGDHPAEGSPDDPAAGSPDDPAEGGPDGADLEEASRRAAVREAAEEAGIELDVATLRRWSHWTPPPRQDKRFTTAFFVAPALDGDAAVVVDDGEITEHCWATPADALARRDLGEITLAPPTFITLTQLLPHRSVDEVMGAAPGSDLARVEHFATRIAVVGEEWIALYHGDVAYEQDEPDADLTGPRHRLLMGATWTYVRDAT